MKLSLNKTEDCMAYFTVETGPIDVDVYMEGVNQRFIDKVENSSSNNSDASNQKLAKHINNDIADNLLIEEIVQKAYYLAIDRYKINTEMQPIIKITQKNPPIFEMAIPLKPVINLCDYHKVKIEAESFDIRDEEVNKVLDGLRKKHCKVNPVDRSIKEGDAVIIDVIGEIESISFINKKGIRYDVMPEYSNELPGLYKELIGLSKGEYKEFKIKFPNNYFHKEVADKEAIYKIKVCEINEVILPDVNDDLARVIAPGVKSIDALKHRIKRNMIMERKSNANDRYINRLMDKLIKESEIKYPSLMLDLQINNLIEQYKQELCASCKDDIEYQEKLKYTNEDVLKAKAAPLAKKRILWSLIIEEVAKIENIKITDEEINKEIGGITSQVNKDQKAELNTYLNNYQNRQDVHDIVKARKTIERLMEIVKTNN